MTEPKERPILFSTPMVRAILGGTKSQTRRVVKPQPDWVHDGIPERRVGNDYQLIRCPYGQPGDRLWVRETTQMRFLENFLTGEPTKAECGEYVADGEPVIDPHEFDLAWWYSRKVCPAIHMPRGASRITLEVTGVRVERLKSISVNDCLAEGVDTEGEVYGEGERLHSAGSPVSPERYAYTTLWESINGPDSWAANPWVWVIDFRRITA